MTKEKVKPCYKCGSTSIKFSSMYVEDEGYSGHANCQNCYRNIISTVYGGYRGGYISDNEFFSTRHEAKKAIIEKWNKENEKLVVLEPKLTPPDIKEKCKLQLDMANNNISEEFKTELNEFCNKVLTKGGKREGAGRPKLPDSQKVKPRKISMTDEEYKNFINNGGARWIRSLLSEVHQA